MKLKPTYKATTKQGFKISGMSGKDWSAELMRMFPSMDLTITVEKRRKTRSTQQNRWYWGVCVPLIREKLIELGNDGLSNEDVHYFLKEKFLQGCDIILADGEIVKGEPTTTALSTSEAMDFYALIQKWSAEILDLLIPDPNEQLTAFK